MLEHISLFMGPTLPHVALSNPEKPLYMPILILGSLISAIAVYLIFKGLKIILNSIVYGMPMARDNIVLNYLSIVL